MYTVIDLTTGSIYPQVFIEDDLEFAAELISKYDNTELDFVIALVIEE